MAKVRERAIHIFIGEVILTIATALATLAFLERSAYSLIRNVLLVDIAFLVVYILFVKVFTSYGKIYKAGLKEED